ncbi:hypothetical protein KFE94_02645 [bacterium SCSIO 12643]|nr:hypothetical protein KFE94_02645 [bacterium SCSIO 12643]
MIRWIWLLGLWILIPCCGCQDSNASETKRPIEKASSIEISNNIVWHWENRFSKDEVSQIKSWLKEIDQAVIHTLGKYNFEMHFYIHRSKRGDEPVPWAHTSRSEEQGVHFHVNMDYDVDEFLNDWTAQHEISHLSIPFLGSSNAWFSEGYATFMQYKIMQNQGVYTAEQVSKRFLTRIAECKENYQSDQPLPKVADSLRQKWEYPDMYWGGFTFFYVLDKQLQKNHEMQLTELIDAYVDCCRKNHSSPEELCKSWDNILGSKIASDLLFQYKNEPARDIFKMIEQQ